MPACRLCHKKSLIFSVHNACKKELQNSLHEISQSVEKYVSSQGGRETIESAISKISSKYTLEKSHLKKAVLAGLNSGISACLEDGVFSKEEEGRFNELAEINDIEKDDLQSMSNSHLLVKNLILRDLIEGEIKSRINLVDCPILFEKDEVALWCFTGAELYEKKNKVTYHGGSSGVSIRVAKGVYYRTSSFKGHRVQTVVTDRTDTGSFMVTSKNLYFLGVLKTHKHPIKKLMSIEPFEDGIGFQETGARAKPRLIKSIDGWFAYNLVTNLKGL